MYEICWVVAHEKTWTWQRKRNLTRETESCLTAHENSAIKTNYIKGKIDDMQQNDECSLCGDKY